MLTKDVNSVVTQEQLSLKQPAPQSFTYPSYQSTACMVREERDNSYQTRAQFERWLREIPVEFPRKFDEAKELPAFFNALVGNDYKHTCENVSHILKMLSDLALPSYTEPADFSLSEEGVLGFVAVLKSLTAALRFEREYRNKADYERDETHSG